MKSALVLFFFFFFLKVAVWEQLKQRVGNWGQKERSETLK